MHHSRFCQQLQLPHTDIRIEKTFNRNIDLNGGNDNVYQVKQKIDGSIDYDLAYYGYDHLGRVVAKQFTAARVLQEYNVRGFLTHIDAVNYNNDGVDTNIFQEQISYDKGFKGHLYNGNIAGITWRKSGDAASWEAYGYTYDLGGRLNKAEYRYQDGSNWIKSVRDYTASNMTYDLNGNILSMDQRGVLPGTNTPIDMDELTYEYGTSSNQLKSVTDAVDAASTAALPDFKDGASLSDEYTYDRNGNLVGDANKQINSIAYNYWNKPTEIVVEDKGDITYVYDADGNRLKKLVHNQNTDVMTEYDYVGNFVYKDNVLQYILNEEGRARPVVNEDDQTTKYVYDYFIKDHLSNVRTTVTASPVTGEYLARHEVASANVEQLVFDNIPAVRDAKPGSTDPDDKMAARLDGADSTRTIGTAIMLRTMPGDRFNINVNAYYDNNTSTPPREVNAASLVASLNTALLGGTNYDNVPLGELSDNVKEVNTVLGDPNLPDMLDILHQTDDPDVPKAHLNWLLFDNTGQLISGSSGSKQVPLDLQGWTNISPSSVTTNPFSSTVQAPAAGFLIVYIDNQTIGKDVWFDNLLVEHYTSEVVEEDHYYPYGLTLQTDENVNVTKNNYKLTAKELEPAFGINAYDFGARMQDMQLGRWWGMDALAEKYVNLSPYSYCANNPALFKDPDGNKITLGRTAEDDNAGESLAALALIAGDYRNRLSQGDGDVLKINTSGLSETDINANPGFKLILKASQSPKSYLIETSRTATGVDRTTGEEGSIQMFDPVNSPTGPPDMNFSTTSRGQEDHDRYVTSSDKEARWQKFDMKPKSGYDGQIIVPYDIAGLLNPGVGGDKSAATILLHGLAEVVDRTENGASIMDAHNKAISVEQSLPEGSPAKSKVPGKYYPDLKKAKEIRNKVQQNQ